MNEEPSLSAARRYARWHLGSPHWADAIIDAYQNPERSNAALDEEQE